MYFVRCYEIFIIRNSVYRGGIYIMDIYVV